MSLTKLCGRGKWKVYTDVTRTKESDYMVRTLKGGYYGVFKKRQQCDFGVATNATRCGVVSVENGER